MKYLILLFLVPFEAIEAVPDWQDLQCQVIVNIQSIYIKFKCPILMTYSKY